MWAVGFVNAWKCAIPSTDFLQLFYSFFIAFVQLFYSFFTAFLQLFYNLSTAFPIEISNLLIHYGTSAKVSPSFFSLHFHLCFLMTPYGTIQILSIYSTVLNQWIKKWWLGFVNAWNVSKCIYIDKAYSLSKSQFPK